MLHGFPARFIHAVVLTLCVAQCALAQPGPVNGMRESDTRVHAIVGASVVTSPEARIDNGTLIIRNGTIVDVGVALQVPADATIVDASGMTIYPGLIEPALLIAPEELPTGPGTHWNSRVHPQVSMSHQPGPRKELREELRALGFTSAAVYPDAGIFRGSGTIIALTDDDEHLLAYKERGPMALGFDHGGSWETAEYPGSLMGAIALIRQTLLDAQWYAQCQQVWQTNPAGNEPPIRADALNALTDVISDKQKVIFDLYNDRDVQRAAGIARQFKLNPIVLGSGLEFRSLKSVTRARLPIIVPLNYPEIPNVSSLVEAENVSLRELMTWEQSPTNARRLSDEGVTIALTTHRLKKRSGFYRALHQAVQHGLSERDALAALTIEPARMLDVDNVLGTIARGKAANFIVVDGSLFTREPEIKQTWVNGRRFDVQPHPPASFKGTASLTTDAGHILALEVNTDEEHVMIITPAEGDEPDAELKKSRPDTVQIQGDRLSLVIDGEHFNVEGYVRITATLDDDTYFGFGRVPEGGTFGVTIGRTGDLVDDEDDEEFVPDLPPDELVYPLGAYGLTSMPDQQTVLITHATLWTCGPEKIINDGWMLVKNGLISAIGDHAKAPPYDDMNPHITIDASGKHMTPGLIDCHSHTGIERGINEWTQVNTAEVGIQDVLNPDDINWYRQLAGGLTMANQLHGSANPIGGKNSVVKLRWGGDAERFVMTDAIGGIKFALGENVIRSRTRYPNTRMGVEAIFRDAFTAAREYKRKHEAYAALNEKDRKRTMPPRPDRELQTLVEILEGKRFIHCHSYRQDEILMLIRVADAFGITIGTFQHVLEGYKVAEAIAKHGAGASAFSDWWAYKVEVMDAVPYNGALMHNVGVNVSFNSDSSELARRMNIEAAKAVRYGGVPREEALKFVTLNPAKQLRIDHRVGSLQVGKDADFVLWSADPLSTYAICEQTWIDGAKRFDLETDQELRAAAQAERQRIIQKVLAFAKKKKQWRKRELEEKLHEPLDTEPGIDEDPIDHHHGPAPQNDNHDHNHGWYSATSCCQHEMYMTD